MTRAVVATFPDAEAARRAAVALGREELAAGPTRVQVDASSPDRGARLELRVDEPDAPRAIALMREHGAAVDDNDDGRDLRGGGPLAAWGMAVADAVTAAMGGATASDAQVPARLDADADEVPGREAPRPDDDPDDPDTLHMRLAPGLRRGVPTREHTGPGDATQPGSSPGRDDSAALIMKGTPRRAPRASGTPPPDDAAGNPLVPGDGASAGLDVVGAPADTAGDTSPATPAVIWGNAPSHGAAGTGSGTHLSDTVAAGTASSMGQIGPGSTIAAAMGATDATGTASGTRTRAAPGTLERADDVPSRDPRPPRKRPKSDA